VTRIVAGRFGGRRLAVPATGTRPTSERAREALFSTLTSLLSGLDGVRFLDLFAGSGAVGLEAWSRGASVVLVESAAPALDVLRSNIANLRSDSGGSGGSAEGVAVVAGKVETVVRELSASAFGVVFADPPYELASSRLAVVVETLVDRGLLADGSVVAVERASRDSWTWPDGIEPVRQRRYGDATVWYGRAAREDRP
jgi:16S rRNA (guanine966-N2)-methyltransferase